MRKLTIEQARRAALGAQGFSRRIPAGRVDRRHFRRVFDDIGLLQLDSVNVLERSHYLPVFARLGHYARESLDDFTVGSGEIFEYWGHEASLLPAELYPVFRFRMEGMRPWRRVRELQEAHPGFIEAIYEEVAANGPLAVRELTDPGSRKGNWWGWGDGKLALEWLFASGQLTAYRSPSFGRLYDLPERVIPPHFRDQPPPDRAEAYRRLLARAASHHGIGTAKDLIDYYRLHGPTARPVLAAMAARGEVVEVDVPGWKGPVFADPDLTVPRRMSRSALLSPFDPVVWERDRAERLFDFHYRIEIYVPKPKRVYGYYVLPYLLDGELVGRVDLKADRQAGVLRVQAAHVEPGHPHAKVGAALRTDLDDMAAWLELDGVEDMRRGNLNLPTG